MLDLSELKELVNDQLMPEYGMERRRLDLIDRWYRWNPEDIRLPGKATSEHKFLREISRAPWLSLVVTATAQCMYVDGYRSALDPAQSKDDEAKDYMEKGPYGLWLANGWDSRQIALHRAMLAYGYAYATGLPGKDFRGKDMPIMRGVSPREMVALYEDPAQDDWPALAMRVVDKKGLTKKIQVYDDEAIYTIATDSSSKPGVVPFSLLNIEHHEAGVVPVVRYCKELDLDGRTRGEVEPYISQAKRINKTSFDRMLIQHYNSWKIRWIAGLSSPDNEEAAVRQKMKLSMDDFLVAEDVDTKFGALPETDLAGINAAHMGDVEALAAISQTPTHELTGQLVNLSAEALAAAKASQTNKVHETEKDAGRSHIQLLKLCCGYVPELEKYVDDVTGRVTWQDTSIQSLAAAVDALGKAATMLEVPVQALWSRIPGVEKADVLEWVEMAKNEQDEIMARQIEIMKATAGAVPPPGTPGAPAPGTAPATKPVGPGVQAAKAPPAGPSKTTLARVKPVKK